jgi:uncharacterized paraquat-inducible protein A
MRARERSYRCQVCGWQGRAVPIDAGDAAPCDRCGTYLYPLSWASTWGLALLLIAGTAAVVAVAMLM